MRSDFVHVEACWACVALGESAPVAEEDASLVAQRQAVMQQAQLRRRAVVRLAISVVVLACFLPPSALHAAGLDPNRATTTVGVADTSPAPSPWTLHLKSGPVDLREKRVPANALSASAAAAAPERAAIPQEAYVQFYDLPSSAERAALAERGVRLHAFVTANTFAASIPAGAVAAVVAEPNVRAVGGIPARDKIAPRLSAGRLARHTAFADGTLMLVAQFHPDVDPYTAGAEAVLRHNGVVLSYLDLTHAVLLRLASAELEAFAGEPAVAWVEQALPAMGPMNDSVRAALTAPVVNGAPHNLEGTGVGVLVYDAGIVKSTHVTFGGRVIVGEPGLLTDHATHVAGTLGGDGSQSVGNAYRGVANAVTILSNQFNSAPGANGWLYTDPGDIETDYLAAITTHGVDLATNSIGTNVALNGFDCGWEGDYQTTSQLIDAIAGGYIAGRRLPIVWAAGNERGHGGCGTAYGTIPPPAPAKNAIVVGAVNSNDLTMTDFSSWGPTDDGRIKPDVVGPGCQTDADGGVTSSVLAGGYDVKCGTSMATPAVAGVVALLTERAMHLGGTGLGADVAKAILIHTAVDEGPLGPDYQFGYGAVHAERAVAFMNAGTSVVGRVGQSEVFERTITAAPGDTSLRVTLVWTDPPGTAMSAVNLMHDLDLVVLAPDGTTQVFPWTLNPADPSAPATRTASDALNNVEQVEVSTRLGDALVPGTWTVRVVGTSVPDLNGQRFALCLSAPQPPAGPDMLVPDERHDFGRVNLGGGELWNSFVIVNQGGAPLTVSGVSAGQPDFTLIAPPTFPAVVPPDGRLVLQVGYIPTAGGAHETMLAVVSDDPYTPTLNVQLSGSTAPLQTEAFDTTDGGYGASGFWQWGTSTLTPPALATPLWGTLLNSPYLNNSSWTLTSPPIDLTGLTSAQLVFDHFYETETLFDGGNVKIAVADGPFAVIDPTVGYPLAAIYSGTNPNAGIPGEPGYSGRSAGVEMAAFDLTPHVGQTVRIRWHFGSDSAVTGPGWYIDNVRLYAADAGPVIAWLTAPPATAAGNTQFAVQWRTDHFGRALDQNAVFFGRTSVVGQSPDRPGPPGTFTQTLTAPNVATPETYSYIARAVSGYVEVLSPVATVNVTPGSAPPTVTWITPPPATVPSGGQFTVSWQVANFVAPATQNAVAWGVTSSLGQTPDQPGASGPYSATVVVPTVTAPGTLYYAAFAQNTVEAAYATPAPVQITVP